MAKIPFFIRNLATESRIANATRDAIHYLADCYRMCADLRLYDEAHYYADIIEENWPLSEDLQIGICMAQLTERQIRLNEKVLMALRKE